MKKTLSLLLMSILVLLFASNVQATPFVGLSSGIFQNPTGPSGMVTDGVGTNSFSWGDGSSPSKLSFAGNPFSVNTDDIFSFGTLYYVNGAIADGTQADTVDLNVAINFSSPSGIIENFIYNLGLINTPNTGDPMANADIVNLPNSVPDTFFTVDGIDYTLEFMGFGETSGWGFITTAENFHVQERLTASYQFSMAKISLNSNREVGGFASAKMFGRITPVEPVPESATMLLLGIGLVGLAGFGRKKCFKK